MEKDITMKYSNEDITIIWKPKMCENSTICWKQLGEVFKPGQHPWIQMEGSTTERIKEQVNRCPSGALSFIKKEVG